MYTFVHKVKSTQTCCLDLLVVNYNNLVHYLIVGGLESRCITTSIYINPLIRLIFSSTTGICKRNHKSAHSKEILRVYWFHHVRLSLDATLSPP